MKRTLRLLLLSAILSVFASPFAHRHAAEHAGILSPHVDCRTCGWSQGHHAPALTSDSSSFSGHFNAAAVPFLEASFDSIQPFAFFLSRAPPLLS